LRSTRTESDIKEKWGLGQSPKVSICCAVYNHDPYLKDAIEGFLMQKTNFAFEIILRDDASTDQSVKIIQDYENKYPSLIKPILYEVNQYAIGNRPSMDWFKLSNAKYLAYCEGDDYWIDPNKLQKQVDILENDDSLVGVFTNYTIHNVNGKVVKAKARNHPSEFRYSQIGILERGVPQTCTVVYRNLSQILDKYTKFGAVVNGDQVIAALMTEYGDVGYVKDVTAVRRIGSGSFSTVSRVHQREQMVKTFDRLKSYYSYNPKLVKAVTNRLDSIYAELVVSSIFNTNFGFNYTWNAFKTIKHKPISTVAKVVFMRSLSHLNRSLTRITRMIK
jgi:glycosyltransferase involved in cell wall biosynthesis